MAKTAWWLDRLFSPSAALSPRKWRWVRLRRTAAIEPPVPMGDGALRVLRRPEAEGRRRRILVVKLDHRGDFIIALPAMCRLREDFPDDEIILICGSWNRTFAESIGIFDRIACYDFFPENARSWDGRPCNPVADFEREAAGRFDIAIDFRVPEDTRFLLSHVDAALRCGLGSMASAFFLDVALPLPASTDPLWKPGRTMSIPAAKFTSRVPRSDPFQYVTDFSVTDTCIFWGPYIRLPPGEYDVTFHFHAAGLDNQEITSPVEFDITCNTRRVMVARLGQRQRDTLRAGRLTLRLNHVDADALVEFRTHTTGKPFAGELRFIGVTVATVGAADPSLERSRCLHIGEHLMLLEQLVQMRVNGPAYPAQLHKSAALPAAALEALDRATAPGGLVCISPLSNASMRDWPLHNYISLVRMMLDRLDCAVALVGSQEQRRALQEIPSAIGEDRRVVNLAGITPWGALPGLFARCDAVIANNSGIGHYAAACGTEVVSLFAASHVVEEWEPRGPNVTTLTYDLACSPCHMDKLPDCPNQHVCMTAITPEIVFDWVAKAMDRAVEISSSRELETEGGVN